MVHTIYTHYLLLLEFQLRLLGVWNESIETRHFPFWGFFLSNLLFSYFPFSLSFHVFLSNQFARAPNSESYEFIIRPCCVIEGVFNFMQMISNSSILGSKFWKENWGLIFKAFWKSFESKKKERKRKLSSCIRIENNRHLDCRNCFSVSLSVDFIRSVACTVNDKIRQIVRTAKFCNQLS